MANATVEVTKSVTVKLTVSEEEAQTLRDILANVGGDPKKSQRKHANNISNALDDAGLVRSSYNARGSINF
jgi:hypothetical protein